MKFHIRYADQVVGGFVLLALAMLTFILLAVGSRQRWFARDYSYNSIFSSGAGIPVGTPILLKGFQIGRIQKVSLTDQNEVAVVFVIYDTYVDKAREHSLLELVTSPIGLGSQLLFHPGKSEKLAEEHSFIPSFDTAEGQKLVADGLVNRPAKDDTITRLISEVNSSMVELHKLLAQANDAFSGQGDGPVTEALNDAAQAVAGVNDLVNELNDMLGEAAPRINSVVAEVDSSLPELLDRVGATANSASVIAANLESTSEAIKDPTGLVPKLLDPQGSIKTFLNDGNRLFNRVDNSLAEVESSIGNLKDATAVLSAQMPRIAATIEEARAAIVKAQDVMEGLKNNPLLRGGIPERVEAENAPTNLRTTDF